MSANTTDTKRPKKADDGVLGALPSTRPARLGRRAAKPKTDPAVTAKAAETVKAAATKPKPKKASTKKAPAKPKPAATAPETSAPKLESVPAEPRPTAVRAGSPSLKPAAEAAERR